MKLRIATRKSALAMAQTTMAADEIVAANRAVDDNRAGNSAVDDNRADLEYELVSMTTEGDRRLDKSLASFGGKGVFIKELEIALLEGRADIAVHSLKDMPAEVLPEFKLAAVLKREDPRDAFLSKGGAAGVKFMDLPAGAKVGTGSIRRVVQLKALRPDLEYIPIRGNIQTRIAKLAELDGVVLAAAGLKRMGLADQVTEYFSTEQVLPASGQGILAIETLKEARGSWNGAQVEGSSIAEILARANHAETYCIAVAEMAFLKALNAGCQFPVASFAEFTDEDDRTMKIRGIYWDEATKRLLKAEDSCRLIPESADAVPAAKALGVYLARKIKAQLA
ncbi:hydroxymethylbilane synthase [Fibrobacter sp.]|uniref:hydroxymethylbilane synthase n=1 Tax=Fibrobacter sp. TaxID=35828 RepID=UPI00388E41F3